MQQKAQSLLLIVLCALCWGPSFLFIKIAIFEIPPLTLVCLRCAIAWGILYAICLVQKQTRFEWKQQWRNYVVIGLSLNVLPWIFISFGEFYISSALAGILNSFALIFTAILSHYFGSHDKFTKNKLLGVVVGVLGLGVIYLPILFHEGIKNAIGVLLLILACLSYGAGTVYVRGHLHKAIPGIVILTAQLAVAAVITLPFALFIDRPFSLPFPSFSALAGALGLAVIGTAVAFLIFYKAIKIAGATYASFSVLLIPIPAMFLGAFFLHETLTWNLYAGTFLILLGVFAVNPAFDKVIKT